MKEIEEMSLDELLVNYAYFDMKGQADCAIEHKAELLRRDKEKDERIKELETKLKSISEDFILSQKRDAEYVVVMRSDLSSVLGDDRGWIMYKDKRNCPYCFSQFLWSCKNQTRSRVNH